MIPPINTDRFVGEWELIAKLAVFLRVTREGRYPDLIAQGHLTEREAFVDEISRAAIAADWQAIAADQPRPEEPIARPAWKIETMQRALANAQARLEREHQAGAAVGDYVDMRDAQAHLLACYEQSFVGMKISEQAERRARGMAGGAEFLEMAA